MDNFCISASSVFHVLQKAENLQSAISAGKMYIFCMLSEVFHPMKKAENLQSAITSSRNLHFCMSSAGYPPLAEGRKFEIYNKCRSLPFSACHTFPAFFSCMSLADFSATRGNNPLKKELKPRNIFIISFSLLTPQFSRLNSISRETATVTPPPRGHAHFLPPRPPSASHYSGCTASN